MEQVILILQERLALAESSLSRKEMDYEKKMLPFYNDVMNEKKLYEEQIKVAKSEVSEIKRAISQLEGVI